MLQLYFQLFQIFDFLYRYKKEYGKALEPGIVSHIESMVHENSMAEICEILDYVKEKIAFRLSGERSGYTNSAAVQKKKEMKMSAESDVVQGVVKSYLMAGKKTRDRIRILSIISSSFTHKELNEDCFKCKVWEYLISPMVKNR